MGFFKRLSRLIKSNVNAVLDAAEDPEKSLEQLIREMEQNYKQAKDQVASAMVDEKRMRRNLEKAQAEAVAWKNKAQMAVKKGDDNLAKQALAKAKTGMQLAAEYEKQASQQGVAVSNLKLALDGLEKKIQEAKRKRQVLVAKKRTVEATQTIHRTVDSIKVDTDSFNEFERLASRIEEMEDKAHVMLEMSTSNLEDKFSKLEVEDELDGELESLKLEMGLGSDPRHQLEEKAAQAKRKKRRPVVEDEDMDDEPTLDDDLDPDEAAEEA